MNDPAAVTAAFDAGAGTYDELTGHNPGYHEHLRVSARRLGLSGDGVRVLDVGCGTGASTAALLAAAPGAEIVGVDASAGMLAMAAAKPWPDTVRFVHSAVEDLGGADLGGPFDAVFAAYLVRNLADPDPQLRALHALLRPGGRLAVHEYVAGRTRGVRLRWAVVCWGIVIPLAAVKGGGVPLYRHLWRSVATFDNAPAFADRLTRAGYVDVRTEPMSGWQRGIEYTFTARRGG
ncbi:methyltransferase [Actinophytocola gossypii]|uniref:Class I SAM-dependent methyltransferase n=1 Tax=Actinophytocola gossypii TaxID=2812003 RepID=A0ABT2JIP6_9PSEU|nr:methyltransferase [Actinophytocola gossypii]MCT2587759.1 class I SAM-dependent methyltransferase [Actinophytocola gossypii]